MQKNTRFIPFLLVFVSALMASPFHLGATWEWGVRAPGQDSIGTRFARVIDSQIAPAQLGSSTQSATIWKLYLADSGSHFVNPSNGNLVLDEDTAVLLESIGTGSSTTSRPQYSWVRGSRLLPLEFRSFDPNIDTIGTYVSGQYSQSHNLPWGFSRYYGVGIRCSTIQIAKVQSAPDLYTATMGEALSGSPTFVAFGFNLPQLQWDSTLGWVRAKWWRNEVPGGVNGSTSDDFPQMEWALSKKDGNPVNELARGPATSIRIPEIGSSYVWEEGYSLTKTGSQQGSPDITNTEDSTFELKWTFLEHPADSAGWARAVVQEVRSSTSGVTKDSTQKSLRWNLSTGESYLKWDTKCKDLPGANVPNPGAIPASCMDLTDGFMKTWSDRAWSSNTFRFNNQSTTVGVSNAWSTASQFIGFIRPQFGFDSSVCNTSGKYIKSGTQHVSCNHSYRLLRMNDTILRQRNTGVLRKPVHGAMIMSLRSLELLAKQHPLSRVQCINIHGQHSIESLESFLQQQHQAGHLETRWLRIRLPDGSTHEGSLLF